jgi:16S rRNA (uracil1498-N3)-methyltransferase
MTRRRWIADEVSGNRAALTGAHADHLARVLRGRSGQEFDISTGEIVRRGRITQVAEGRVEFELGELVPAPAVPSLTLWLSIFKFDRLEWAIEKCSELGAARIVPLIAQRTSAHLAAAAPKRAERWQRLARQASEQSRRTSPPEITPPVKLKAGVMRPSGTGIVLAETKQAMTLKQALENAARASEITLAIGPEGGWTQPEMNLFLQAGWTAAALGTTILRAETAAIAATAIALAALG